MIYVIWILISALLLGIGIDLSKKEKLWLAITSAISLFVSMIVGFLHLIVNVLF